MLQVVWLDTPRTLMVTVTFALRILTIVSLTDLVGTVERTWFLNPVLRPGNSAVRLPIGLYNTVHEMNITTNVFGHKIADTFSVSVCAAGTERNGTGCTPCPPWAYHPGGVCGPVSCTPCPLGNIAPSLATSSEQCYGNVLRFVYTKR